MCRVVNFIFIKHIIAWIVCFIEEVLIYIYLKTMPSCIIAGCANRTDPKRKRDVQIEVENYKKISYHRFPQESHKRQLWLAALGLHKWDPSKTATVCSEHFTNDDFQNWCTNKRILKKTAVPSIYLLCNDKSTSPASCNLAVQNEAGIEAHLEQNDMANVKSANVPVNIPDISEKTCRTPTSSVMRVDSSTSITPKRLFNSPTKQRIRKAYKEEIKLLRQQLYKLRKQQMRYKKRLTTLDNVLHSVKQKNLLSMEEVEIIENFTPINEEESICFP